MDMDQFWDLIEQSRHGAEDCDEQAGKLKILLTALQPDDIQSFDRLFWDRLFESYRWDLWAVAYIINGGCSDDSFGDFRAWLIARGKEVYEAALQNPETAAKGVKADEAECEAITYAALYAYQEKTGEEMPVPELNFPEDPRGEPWTEADLPQLYPKLWKRFTKTSG